MHFSITTRLSCHFTPSFLQSIYRGVNFQKHLPRLGIYVQPQTCEIVTYNPSERYFCSTSHYTVPKNVQQHSVFRKAKSFSPLKIFSEDIHSHPKAELSELEEFEDVLNLLCKDMMSEQNPSISEALKWHLKVLQYNVKNGKKNRGLAVGKTYKILSGVSVIQHHLHLAHILGWCVEMLQAFFLICDDIMDNSSIRRGKPCWYKKPEVGLCAINDSLLLQSGIYKILKNYFNDHDCYKYILEEFLDATRNTVYGQCLDMLSNPNNKTPQFETYTMERYNAIVEYKTSYYTYCLPVRLAMHLIGKYSPQDFQVTNHLCLKLGLLFQVQDDYLDCFGDPKVTGKVGTDIVEGKCTWFAVRALQDAQGDMREEILKNYGSDDAESTAKVLNIYDKLSLKEKYLQFEESMYKEIKSETLQLLSDESTQKLFDYLLLKTYRRDK